MEHILTWTGEDFRLELFDTGRTGDHGKARLAYRFYHKGALIFEGDDYFPSSMHGIDSNDTVAGLLAFLSLKPGDTDSEWFDSYTREQLAWAQAHGEELSSWVERLENPILYHRETESGDYLAVDPLLFQIPGGRKLYEGRATAIRNHIASMSTTSVSEDFLREQCVQVDRQNVPEEWIKAIGL